jgi:hypothetical protein
MVRCTAVPDTRCELIPTSPSWFPVVIDRGAPAPTSRRRLTHANNYLTVEPRRPCETRKRIAGHPKFGTDQLAVRDGLLSEHVFQKREDVGVRFLRRRFVVVQRHTTLETRIGRT